MCTCGSETRRLLFERQWLYVTFIVSFVFCLKLFAKEGIASVKLMN